MLKNKESNNIQLNTAAASLKEGRKGVALQDNRVDSSKAQIKTIQRKVNKTGMPDVLKNGIEHHSGISMDDVKVHYNSDKPSQLQAHAYAQGTDIHIAPGQEKHLAHEAWHVVQQKQGRVQPTRQMKGKVAINDDKGLEKEADRMGAKALQTSRQDIQPNLLKKVALSISPLQRVMNTAGGFSATHSLPATVSDQVQFSGNQPLSNSSSKAEVYVTRLKSQTDPADLLNMRHWAGFANPGGASLGLIAEPMGGNTLTRMHLINGTFHGPKNANNMVLGTQQSNNPGHLSAVETPIRNFLGNKNTIGVKYTVEPNFNGPPGYIRDRITTIADRNHRAAFRNWARQACPTSLKCTAVFYQNRIVTGGPPYEAKKQEENITTTAGGQAHSMTAGDSVAGSKLGGILGVMGGAVGANFLLGATATLATTALTGGLGLIGGGILGGLIGAAGNNVFSAIHRGDTPSDIAKSGLDGIKDTVPYYRYILGL